ncbi:hypothetical protein YC2023_070649 [Brassica napus]
MRKFYKNWTDSKKKRYGSKESIRSNLEKDVNSMGGFAHHGVVEDDYLMIEFKQMRSLIGVQEIDLPNSSCVFHIPHVKGNCLSYKYRSNGEVFHMI